MKISIALVTLFALVVSICTFVYSLPGDTIPAEETSKEQLQQMAKMTPPDPIMQELERLENYPPAGEEPDEVFYITAIQYCEACHAVVEEFYHHRYAMIKRGVATKQMNFTYTKRGLEYEFCSAPKGRFRHWKQHFEHGCVKIVQEEYRNVLPFLGRHTAREYHDLRAIRIRKNEACIKHANCPENYVVADPPIKDDCTACKLLAGDIHQLMFREKVPIEPVYVKDVVDRICDDLGLRHDKFHKINEYCLNYIDDHGWTLQNKTLPKIYNDASITDKKMALLPLMCEKLEAACTPSTSTIPDPSPPPSSSSSPSPSPSGTHDEL